MKDFVLPGTDDVRIDGVRVRGVDKDDDDVDVDVDVDLEEAAAMRRAGGNKSKSDCVGMMMRV